MDISVRISKKTDRTAVMELAGKLSDQIHLAKKQQRLERAIGTPELLVAEADGTLAGFIYVYFKMAGRYETSGSDELHVSALAIDPRFREHGFDHGVGQALIGAIIGSTDKPITADVVSTDFNTMSIFTSKGFRIVTPGADKVTMMLR